MFTRNSTIVIATRNAGKVREFQSLLEPHGIVVRSLVDFAQVPPVEESGHTFAQNSLLKAQITAQYLQIPVLADDSGLCVDALGGAPGVRSARYAGEHATDDENNSKLLYELAHRVELDNEPTIGQLPELGAELRVFSSAYFECAITLVNEKSEPVLLAQGRCHGYIVNQRIGTQGFGYDPLFYVPQLQKTMAQCSPQEKNQISHRAIAMQQFMAQWISPLSN